MALLLAVMLLLANLSPVLAQEDGWCEGVEPAFQSFPVAIYFDDGSVDSEEWRTIIEDALVQIDSYVPVQLVDQPITRGQPGININIVPADQMSTLCENDNAVACTRTRTYVESQTDAGLAANEDGNPGEEIAWVTVNLPPEEELDDSLSTLLHEILHAFFVEEEHSLNPDSIMYRAQNGQRLITEDVSECLDQLYDSDESSSALNSSSLPLRETENKVEE